MTDLFKTTADQLRFALAQEWLDLYNHKSEWEKEAEDAENAVDDAYEKAYKAYEGGKLSDKEVDELYSIAAALNEDARAKRERVERLEEAMEAIDKLEIFYSEDWKEV